MDNPLDGNALASALLGIVGPVEIDGLTQLSGGASRQTWAFDAVAADGTRTELVLRRDPPGRPSQPGAMGREAAAIGLAAAAGLAVPQVLLVTDGPELWGTAGMVMRRIPGQTLAPRILRDEEFRPARSRLAGQLGEFAAGLHAQRPPAGFPAPDPLASLREMLEAVGRGSPVFDLALTELAATRPPRRDPVLVHGDLRLGNLMVGPEGLRAVLDWELTHAGEPAEDLGWLCVRAWRFGGPGPVAGVGARTEFLAAYRAAGGAEIGLDELRWWEILGTVRWGVMCLTMSADHLSGAERSVELAAIGRRVSEQEWDLLTLLDPAAASRAARSRPVPTGAAVSTPAPYGRPTASELLESVREYLLGSVLPASDGQLAFHARVAANVLAIVARELELGPPPAGLDLAGQVAASLAVANPKYFGPAPPGDSAPPADSVPPGPGNGGS